MARTLAGASCNMYRLVMIGLCLVAACQGKLCAQPVDAGAVAARIDQHFADRWAKDGIRPASLTGDDVFLRRVTLDLVGRIPTVQELLAFRGSDAANRRQRAIDGLLNGSGYARNWANLWRHHFLPQADTPKFASFGPGFETWLCDKLVANASYDDMCREMLTSPPPVRGAPLAPAHSFVAVTQGNPEVLAGSASRVFLGVNLDCAQCHNHPHARWRREQFWEFAAFFAPPKSAGRELPVRFEVQIPETTQVVSPQLFNGDKLQWPARLEPETGRHLLAQWITKKDNPFFARNAVNRVWAQMLGRGLIEPLDDLSDGNPASHPAVMDELARAFVASGYDLKYLIRIVAATRAYQLSSASQEKGEAPDRFAAMAVRGLSGEQMFDSLILAAGMPLVVEEAETEFPNRSPRQAFLQLFHDVRPAASQRSILQALELINGGAAKIANHNKTVLTAAEAPFLDAQGRVDMVFLAVLSRPPSSGEAQQWIHLVNTADLQERRRALGDLFWVLVNTAEFGVNY